MTASQNDTKHLLAWLATAGLALNLLTMLLWHFEVALSSWFYILIGLGLLFALRMDPKKISLILIFLSAVGIAVIGEPVKDWDARSIWFFHARKLFFDNGFHTQLSDYASFSHNDYPVLVPALTAAIARTAGFWSESLPKLSLVLALIPPALIAATIFKTRLLLLWMVGVSFIGSRLLLNGYMDAILGIYMATTTLLLSNLYMSNEDCDRHRSHNLPTATLILMIASLCLIKNEGLMAALTIVAVCSHFYRSIGFKTILALALGIFISYGLWKFHVSAASIPSDLFTSGLLDRLFSRLTNPADLFQLLSVPAVNTGLILTFYLLVFSITQHQKHHTFILLISCMYVGGMLLIYAITPHNLQWHIGTSANRTMISVNILLFTMLIYAIQGIIPNNTEVSDPTK